MSKKDLNLNPRKRVQRSIQGVVLLIALSQSAIISAQMTTDQKAQMLLLMGSCERMYTQMPGSSARMEAAEWGQLIDAAASAWGATRSMVKSVVDAQYSALMARGGVSDSSCQNLKKTLMNQVR